ncbi:MAG: hypothetical protein R3D98_04715 [Candidatus Krumholzibacteriia bacterium]
MDFGGQGRALVGGAVYTETHWIEGDDCVYETVSFELAEECRMYVSFRADERSCVARVSARPHPPGEYPWPLLGISTFRDGGVAARARAARPV